MPPQPSEASVSAPTANAASERGFNDAFMRETSK
jgi:hypothetical protein